eukprot:RCo050898
MPSPICTLPSLTWKGKGPFAKTATGSVPRQFPQDPRNKIQEKRRKERRDAGVRVARGTERGTSYSQVDSSAKKSVKERPIACHMSEASEKGSTSASSPSPPSDRGEPSIASRPLSGRETAPGDDSAVRRSEEQRLNSS